MGRYFAQVRVFLNDVVRIAKARKALLFLAAAFLVLQLYFVRELIAAELLFGLGFAVLLVLVGIFYVVGVAGERLIGATQVGARVVAHSAREGYAKASPVLDVAAKRSLDLAGAGAKVVVRAARVGVHKAEEISKKPFRHPRSESAR
jgi:hypothetical protein